MDNTIKKTKHTSLLVLKIIFLIAHVLISAFLIISMFDSLSSANPELSLALYLALIVIIFGTIGYAVCLILAIVGLIISIVKKSKNNIIVFTIFMFLPILTEFLIIIITKNIIH